MKPSRHFSKEQIDAMSDSEKLGRVLFKLQRFDPILDFWTELSDTNRVLFAIGTGLTYIVTLGGALWWLVLFIRHLRI